MTANEPILYHGDYRQFLSEIEDYSLDLVLCDPPYWHHKSPSKPYNERRQCKTKSKTYNVFTKQPAHKYKVVIEKNCFYFWSLNEKNAKKKLRKAGFIK